MPRIIALIAISTALASCGGDPGLIDCTSYVDRHIECELIPAENAAAVRDTNIDICNSWERTYKEEVMTALSDCIAVPCEGLQSCVIAANALCHADVSASIESLCEKVVECGWEELTTMELCREELAANQGLYQCLKPSILADYVACVRGISCGSESEDEWYQCGFEHVY